MKTNWKLIFFDAIVILSIGLTIYVWNDSDDFHKFLWGIMSVIWLVRQVDEHISFYKKEKRFY